MTSITKTISILSELRAAVSGGIVTNDRGNGCGGPGYVAEGDPCDADADTVSVVSESDDPEAWKLARVALRAHKLDCEPELVAVGDRSDSGHQMIFAG